MKYNSYFIISSQWILKPVLRVKNKFWLKFCSYHADEYGRTVEMIISSSFFFYHVNFIIDQLSVMQNNFKYWVSCIGIINKYALLSELDKGIIQSWPMGALVYHHKHWIYLQFCFPCSFDEDLKILPQSKIPWLSCQ